MAYFHATPSTCVPGIAARGLRTGRAVGALPHAGFGDSLDYLHVSDDLRVAQWWARVLGERNQEYVIYCVDDRCSDIRVRPDPLSQGQIGFGFIVEGGYIPAEWLTVIETVPVQTGFPDACETLSVLSDNGWVVPYPERQGPPGLIVWKVGGFKGQHMINPVYGETRREAAWKALEQLRRRGLIAGPAQACG